MPPDRRDPSHTPPDDVRRLDQQIRELQARLEQVEREHRMHFTRLAQLQADVDVIRARTTSKPGQPYAGPERRRTPSE